MARQAPATVEIHKPDIRQFTMKVVGTAPLIMHAWSAKSKRMILDKETKKATKAREIRKPWVDFAESLYWLAPKPKPDFEPLSNDEARELFNEIAPNAVFGFPSVAFKQAALDAGFQQGALVARAGTADLAKTTARGAFFIQGEFVTIHGMPEYREDVVRVGQGTDLRYRGEFPTWTADIPIEYNAHVISVDQIVNIFNLGGFSNGVGEWRPARDGTFGTFQVVMSEPI